MVIPFLDGMIEIPRLLTPFLDDGSSLKSRVAVEFSPCARVKLADELDDHLVLFEGDLRENRCRSRLTMFDEIAVLGIAGGLFVGAAGEGAFEVNRSELGER